MSFSDKLQELIETCEKGLQQDIRNLIINSKDKRFVTTLLHTNFFESLNDLTNIATVEKLYNKLIDTVKPGTLIELLLDALGNKIPCARVRGLYNVVEKYMIMSWLMIVKDNFPESNDYKHTSLGASWIRNILRPTFRELILDNPTAISVYGSKNPLCIRDIVYKRDITNYPGDDNCVKVQEKYTENKDRFLNEYSLIDSCPNPESLLVKLKLKDLNNDDENWLKLVNSALKTNETVTTNALSAYCDYSDELGIELEPLEKESCDKNKKIITAGGKSKWLQFVELFSEKNKHLTRKEVLQQAKLPYKKLKQHYESR